MTCVNGDLEAVREQLDKGADITWRSPHRGMVSTGHYLRETYPGIREENSLDISKKNTTRKYCMILYRLHYTYVRTMSYMHTLSYAVWIKVC